MKNIIFVFILLLLLAGLGYGYLQYQELEEEIEQVQIDKEIVEQLVNIYNHTLKNPLTPIDTSTEYFQNVFQSGQFGDHLQDMQEFIISNLENLDTLDYQTMYAQTQSRLVNAQSIIDEIKQDKELEVEKKNELIDSLVNIKNSLIKRTAEKDQALNKNIQNLDSLKQVIDLYEQSKKEIVHFKSPSGVAITYFGQTKNGRAHGIGIGVYANGNKYDGEWENGKKHGEGIYEFPDGEKYEGRFVEDKRNGFGLYKWPNGDVYTGYWKNDRRHGEGVIKDKSGKVVSTGIWTNDLLEKTREVNF